MKRFVLFFLSVFLLSGIIVKATTNKTDKVRDDIESLGKAYEIDKDSLFIHLDKIERDAESSDDAVVKSVYYSYLAKIYNDYYHGNRFLIDDRTDIGNPAPEDRNEWTKQNFHDVVRRYTELSVNDKDALLGASITDYRNLIEAGTDSVLRPTMYDVLMHKAIEIMNYDTAQVSAYYRQLIDAHKDNALVRDAVKLEYAMYKIDTADERMGDGFANQYKGSDLYVYAKALEIDHSKQNPKTRHEECEKVLNEYMNNPYINEIKRIKGDLEVRFLSLDNSDGSTSTILYPGKDEQFTIKYKNVDSVKVELFKVNMSASEYAETGEYSLKESQLKPIMSEVVALPQFSDFEEHTAPYKMNGVKCGIYLIKISDCRYPNDLTSKGVFFVTKFMTCSRTAPDGTAEIYVVDRLTGKPQKGVTINCRNNKNRSAIVKSGEFGIAVLPKDLGPRVCYTVESGKDKFHPQCWFYYNNQDDKESVHYKASLFLDRGVYRPGQKVMAKGIVYTEDGDNYNLVTDKDIVITLNDANGSELKSQTVKTNEYGSFYAEFEIPTGLLSGRFSISCQYGKQYFAVEEYKRPAFEVKIDSVKAGTVSDPIMVKGVSRYYRGMGTKDAKVSYNVTSAPAYFCGWHWVLPQSKSNAGFGDAVCDNDGNYSFQFTPDIKIEDTHPLYRLTISVNVTDAAGETQSASYSLVIGETSFSLAFPVSGLTDRDNLQDTAPRAYDTAGNSLIISGKYTITDIGEKAVATGEFKTGENIDFSKLPSGKYSIKLTARDEKERMAEFNASFTLYSVKDRKPAEESLLWLIPIKTECDSTDNAEFILGSSFDSHILMEVYDRQVLVERKLVDVKSSCTRYKVGYKASFSDSVCFRFLVVKNGKCESKEMVVNRKRKPRNLKLELTHIKEVYAPGDNDRWSVRITDADGKPITAELLASMYDMSLDAIGGNSWSFDPVSVKYKFADKWSVDLHSSSLSCSGCYYPNRSQGYKFSFPSLNMFGFDIYRSGFLSKGMPYNAKVTGAAMLNAVSEPDVNDVAEYDGSASLETECDIRKNFAETAFFFPQLNAEDGSCTIEFSAPEALTKWKVMILAYNKDLRTAVLTDTIITQKTLSVNPNLPRFVRTSDSLTLAATVDKLSAEIGDVDVKWRVEDAVTGEVISTTNALRVPMTASILKVNVTAKGGDYTDGVETLIPVLSSQTLVTESMPIVLSEEGEFSYTFKSMANNKSETLVNRGYSISITPDAATLVLQSLPYIGDPQNENAFDYALAYYANWLSSKVVNENERLAAYLRRLKDGTQDVKSPLEANQDLKNILLQESPWVMDAKFETDCNKSLVDLIDTKAQKGRREALLKKLFMMQKQDGGFTWFEGGNSSPSTTLFVAERLEKSGYSGSGLKKAIKYLMTEMEKNYEDALKNKRQPKADLFDMRVMLLAGETQSEASEYYYKQIKEGWKKYTLPEQAVISQLLKAFGDTAEAKAVIDNIRKFSVFKPTMGLYWPNTSNICTQAGYIKAFAAVDPDSEELAKMKMWLLFHKQANMWGNSVATANAIDALMLNDGKVYADDAHVIVKVGDVTIDSDSAQWADAVDYKFCQPDVSKKLADVNVTKSGKALTLGAAYWQYTEDVDKVKKHTDGTLALKKEYFVEKDGKLQPLDSVGGVKVGDIVNVRLVVKADRMMQFVHLRDLRPAGLEPVNNVSCHKIMGGIFYYETSKDCSTDLFIEYMPKGTYVFEYQLKANSAGDFAAGFASIESMYSNDFKSQTAGCRMEIR